jgi:cytosine deaminase
MGALEAVGVDRAANWSAADVEARMDFALRCAFAHGTTAIRTHLDCRDRQTRISFGVFARMRERWAGRIALEASPLYPIDMVLDDAHMAEVLAVVGEHGHTLGAVTSLQPEIREGLDRLFRLASERGWNLDFHVDETLDPEARSLRAIAETALHYRFQGTILAGHCCSLAVLPDDDAKRTMELVARAGIAVVSLPMCNMYLQSRAAGVTPRRRGVTALHELKAHGVKVMVASDNTRDPFYAYGDLDMVEVYREATRIAHLDHPVGDWIDTITATPARHLGLADRGTLAPGARADLVLLRGRSWNEFLSRPWSDRLVLREGRASEAWVPDYSELDEVLGL